jgi:cobalt/nickel transport system permease protein
MHISEGVLSVPVLAGGWAVAATGLALGLKKIEPERLPEVGLLSAVFFVASLIHVPIGPVSAHLVLNGLIGLILGASAFPAIFVGLALQAVLFQFGGLVVLGVNTTTMALPAFLCGLLFRPLLATGRRPLVFLAGGLAGFFGVLLAGCLTSAALALSGEGFVTAAQAVLLAHVPVMAVEAVLTALAVGFLAQVQPALLAARRP